MTFEDQETSIESGLPVSLFHITYGPGADDHYFYTDFDESVDYDGDTYEPVPIGRDPVETSGGLDNQVLVIRISPLAEIVRFMQIRTPTQEVAMVIRQGHADDPMAQFLAVWSGRLTSVSMKDTFAELACESIVTSINRPGLKRSYSRGCVWPLYSEYDVGGKTTGCQAARTVRASFQPQVVGRNLIVPPAGWNGAYDKEKFLGGYASWPDAITAGNQVRTILGITESGQGDVLNLQGQTDGLSTAALVSLYLGCNHLVDDCENLHDNLVNYGGQNRIPQQNPIGYLNRYY